MRDIDTYFSSEAIWEIPAFGISAFNIPEAAGFVAKILCLEGLLDKHVPDEEDQYSIDNPILPDLLKEEISEYEAAILAGVEKGTLKTLYVSRDIHDQIRKEETYIDAHDVRDWFDERDISISGDMFAEFQDNIINLQIVAVEAITREQEKRILQIDGNFDSEYEERIYVLEKKIGYLKDQVARKKKHTDKSQPLSAIERQSMLKMILGMAIEQYGYDPNSKRNSATSNITSDLALSGLSIDSDTVRKWLNEAKEYLPDNWDTTP